MSVLRRMVAGAIVARANTDPFERPDRLPRALAAMAPWGPSLAGTAAAATARYPDRVAVADDAGEVTYRVLWREAQAVAHGLAAHGARPGVRIGLLARNHRGLVRALIAVAATGADAVLLNTGFAAPQLADVVTAESIDVLVHDDEFAGAAAACGARVRLDETTMEALAQREARVRPPASPGSLVILTSGTTGRPKGAERRSGPAAIEGAAALLGRIPFRLGDTQVIAAPLFHAWGLAHLALGLGRCATIVVARRFDAAGTLTAVSTHRARVLVVVPVMLARMVALPAAAFARAPTPQLRIVASSGSALGSRLADDTLARFGPVLYNVYGSTEVAIATVATPADLRQAPTTAGRPAFGVRVEILDAGGDPVPGGGTGRVFVGGPMRFDGYTGGGGKEQHRGLLASGDLGHFDKGLLFVDGREDDMIVSGGENVYPVEVEELLARHPAIDDVVVVGVPDAEFGQALAAFVVTKPGTMLDADEVRAFVRERLARHKVPRQVGFLAELPRNATGKVRRHLLVDPGRS